ncbi:hypothetical protein CBL_01817 [Carabus blaptoides fortunei]
MCPLANENTSLYSTGYCTIYRRSVFRRKNEKKESSGAKKLLSIIHKGLHGLKPVDHYGLRSCGCATSCHTAQPLTLALCTEAEAFLYGAAPTPGDYTKEDLATRSVYDTGWLRIPFTADERTSSPSTGSRQTKRSILFTSHQTEIDFRPSELIKRRRVRPGKHEMIARLANVCKFDLCCLLHAFGMFRNYFYKKGKEEDRESGFQKRSP